MARRIACTGWSGSSMVRSLGSWGGAAGGCSWSAEMRGRAGTRASSERASRRRGVWALMAPRVFSGPLVDDQVNAERGVAVARRQGGERGGILHRPQGRQVEGVIAGGLLDFQALDRAIALDAEVEHRPHLAPDGRARPVGVDELEQPVDVVAVAEVGVFEAGDRGA